MYEDQTYDVIMARMKAKTLEMFPGIDTREGSVVHIMLGPAAAELAQAYITIDAVLNETFADTASREGLIKIVYDRKRMSPEPATKAILKGVFTPSNLNLDIGQRFSLNGLFYAVKSKISDGLYQIECETAGVAGNQNFGNIVPVTYVPGLETAEIAEILIPGEDEEDTESLRQRYFDSFETKSFGGNVADYLEKTKALPGVGSVKVTRTPNGGGTVKLTILDSDYNKASPTLVGTVQAAIDPTQDGQGLGLAPIDHTVIVDTPKEVIIDISTTITYDAGYGYSSAITDSIERYLLGLREAWADQGSLIVRIAQIETGILSNPGILDIANTKINGVANNLTLSAFEIPVIGSVTA